MAGYGFNADNLNFYSIVNTFFPDEIDITVTYNDFKKGDESTIINGIQIFLDNYLGELNFVTTIDNLIVIDAKDAQQELVPIEKLSSFLIWRQKEFIEKYEGLRHNTDNDRYSGLTAERRDGKSLVAVVNTDLLNWNSKASHPWIMIVEIKFDGESNNGMPDEEDRKLLDEIEEKIIEELKDFEGYLNIGRETVDSSREIYFACKEFRKPSKILRQIQDTYENVFDVEYDIYKDKYWQSFKRFITND